MRRHVAAARGLLVLVALAASVTFAMSAGCIFLTGVQDFEKGPCEGNCADAAPEADTAGVCPGMIRVAGGSYVPASRPGSGIVRVEALCVDPTEVTESSYRACVASGRCTAPPNRVFCNYSIPGRENDPINCVDLTQAKTFCESSGKRLPNEDEWEWVARGGPLGLSYPWGNVAPTTTDAPERLCWQGKVRHDEEGVWPNRPAGSCPVRSYEGREGIFDLSGNVWEWTSTAAAGTTFVFRGGSAFDPAEPTTTFGAGARRTGASTSYPGVGFRCFKTL